MNTDRDDPVWPHHALRMLDSTLPLANGEQTRAVINQVADLYRRWIAGNKPNREEWVKARCAAYAATEGRVAPEPGAYLAADAAYAAYNPWNGVLTSRLNYSPTAQPITTP
jgi:hypothetical protein